MALSEADIRCEAYVVGDSPYFIKAEHVPTGIVVMADVMNKRLPYMKQREVLVAALEAAVKNAARDTESPA